ncbi:MAG: lamin tail domain-containing protein, partial [Pirellulales bacterium]
MLAAGAVISELMAANRTVLADEDGDFSDWLEIRNPTPAALDLGGWYLTDDADRLTKWQLPQVTLAPDSELLVFASDKDRTDPDGQLHTNFKLNANGEYLALVRPDGVTVEHAYSPEFPTQVDDVSYGLTADLAGEGYFLQPTPGAANLGDPVEDPLQAVLVTEIMYHPASEAVEEEYIELYNRGIDAVDLSGWQVASGVDFLFPDVTLAAGDYLVVAADVDRFTARYPNVENVVGGWEGRLSNRTETIELRNAADVRIDRVTYADEGDWATRAEGPLDRGSRGWVWTAAHDGGGSSLELIDRLLPNGYGQNWASSLMVGGTPGEANSVASSDQAPLILDVVHGPILPRSTDPVTVTARLVDELASGATATLYWRVDGAAAFQSFPMFDDGLSGDGSAGDHRFAATIPAQSNRTIVEFYVSAEDVSGNRRTWPAPVEPSGLQQANLLYQVLNAFDTEAAWDAGSSPVYFEIMTAAERTEFTNINRGSDAQMNATFISLTGTGVEVRYNAGIRIRGSGSRSNNPPNNRINLPSDRPWHGVDALNINVNGIRNQIAGSALFRLAGLPAADAKSVRLISNGINLNGTRAYAHVETLNTDFAGNHVPQDNGGNLYKGRRPNESPPGGQGAGLVYFGPDPAPYVSYAKLTNASQADWSDVIHLTDVLNNAPDETYVDDVEQVVDVDQWLRFFALNALLDNSEGGLVNGDRFGDDYAMYRGVEDRRFRMIPHDLDSLFSRFNRAFFRATGVPALNRLINHPQFLPRYYAQLIDLMDNVLLTERARTTLDEALRGVGDTESIMNFLQRRADFVRQRIPREFTVDTGLPMAGGFYRTTRPSLSLSGTADVIETRSILVNGQVAGPLPGDGSWSFSGGLPDGGVETLLPTGSVWKYLDDGSDQGVAWREPAFDDSSWASGPAPLGYGDGNESTVVGFIDTTPETPASISKNATTYFRTTFTVDDPANLVALRLQLRYDDAAAVYINGVEAARTDNLSPDAAFDTYTIIDTPDETAFFSFDVPASLLGQLVAGENSIAVEIHQGDAFSSDIKLDLELTAFRGVTTSGGLLLNPGINRIVVEAFDGPNGMGSRIATSQLDVWYDGPAVSNRVVAPEPEFDRLELSARDSYLPGVPILVRIAARQADGQIQRDLWDGLARLSTDRADVTLSETEVRLYNGQGSALVTVSGGDDFTLTVRLGDQVVERRIRSLAGTPITTVAGTLEGTSTSWSGIVRVTDDVVVPAGHTLSVAPGTLVLLDGDPVGATDSTTLTVQGSLVSQGTAEAPITWTATDPQRPWGQIDLVGGDADLAYTALHRAGNATRLGHTGTGAAVRLRDGASFTLAHGSITDLNGKIMQSNSGSVVLTDVMLARAVMGPEIQGTSLDFTDSWIVEMAGVYHYAGVVDDNDGIYLHDQQPGQTIRLTGGVVVGTQDDGIDTLRSDVTITDMIVRDIFDKAVSIFDGEVTIDRSLLVRADIGVNTKGAGSSTPRTIIDRTTVADVNRALVAQDKDAPDPNVRITYEVTNSILRVTPGGDAVSTDYDPADIRIDYSNIAEPWPGTGNIDLDPLFFDTVGGDYRLQPGSPSIDAADPAAALDQDGSRADQGARGNGIAGTFAPSTLAGGTIEGTLILTPYGGPYRVTGNVVVAPDARMMLLPGTSVYFDAGTGFTVQGRLDAQGSTYQRIRLTSVPDVPPVPDLPGLPDGPPRWDGIRFLNTMSDQNIVSRTDIEYAQSSQGSIGAVDSQVLIDGVTWKGTHRRMVYANRSSLTIRNSIFPDMFAPGESPAALGLDNVAEHIKGEGGIPDGGHFIIENNLFGTNKGHNDVIDVTSGSRPDPILEIRDNVFLGSGDELLDLGGDVYVTGNLFAHVAKDADSSDRGYANAISTGDGRFNSDVVVSRNIFWDVDHAINLKRGTATIFENNTVVGIHDDFVDQFGDLNVASAINFFVDEPGAQPGRGAYVAGNIFSDAPRVFGNIDLPAGTTSDLQFETNLVTRGIANAPIGDRPESLLDLGMGNLVGEARFVDVALGDFGLKLGSPAQGEGPLGQDLGAGVPAGAWIDGEPPAVTASDRATLRLGGPGIFAVKVRVDGGPWSDPISVGSGFEPEGGTVRTVTIDLTDLAVGPHSVDVLGQDFAGRWQESPTRSKTWTVTSGGPQVRINEVLAINRSAWLHDGSYPDLIELFNAGSDAIDLGGMRLTDNPNVPDAFVFSGGTLLAPGEYLVLIADDTVGASGLHLGFSLDGAGEGVFLYDQDGALVDAVEFGHQIPDLSIGRAGHEAAWTLTRSTPGAANEVQPTADASRLAINEWFASGDIRVEDDFLELYNPRTLPVAMGGLFLSDKPDAVPDKFQVAPLSFIGGGQFATFIADGKPQKGADHLTFKLSANQELLALFDTDGTEIDRVLYYPQTTYVSQGRVPDGGETGYAFSRLPTPGAPNIRSAFAEVIV